MIRVDATQTHQVLAGQPAGAVSQAAGRFFQSNLLDGPGQCLRKVFDCLKRAWEAVVNFFKSLFSGSTPLTPHQREWRLPAADTVKDRLTRQMQRTMEQMAQEPAKLFQYQDAPVQWDAHLERVGGLEVGVSHIQGRRASMEDEHLATFFNVKVAGKEYPLHLFGIFDGHGGAEAAQFVRDHLQTKLQESLIEFNPQGLNDAGIWNALKMTCVRLNQDLRNHNQEIAEDQGTTATITMILDQKLWTANVGDSRVVLDNGGTPVQCTEDAKPGDARYKQGIEHRGGKVVVNGIPRVCGDLGVARAIGDQRLNGAVSARPKITMKPLSEIQQGSHLVLACDGIYDVSTTKDIVDATHQHANRTARGLARNITFSAYQAGSGDNLSAMVVKIK